MGIQCAIGFFVITWLVLRSYEVRRSVSMDNEFSWYVLQLSREMPNLYVPKRDISGCLYSLTSGRLSMKIRNHYDKMDIIYVTNLLKGCNWREMITDVMIFSFTSLMVSNEP